MRKPNPLFLAPALLLAGCATDTQFGETVNRNIALQTVDMNPQYAGVPMEGTDTTRGAEAFRRYSNGQIKQLLRPDGRSGFATQDITVPQEKRR